MSWRPFPVSSILPGILLWCALVGPVMAAHVTDKLVVGLYASAAVEGTPLRLLTSGTPLDVLETQAGFKHVRLADNTQGWIEADYVSEEKPAKAVLLETQARLRQMGLELAALREQQGTTGEDAELRPGLPPSADTARLRRSLEQAQAQITELERRLAAGSSSGAASQRLSELQHSVRRATALLAEAQGLELRGPPPMRDGLIGRYQSWIVAMIALLLGFGAGVAFIDYRLRRRHGGFRI